MCLSVLLAHVSVYHVSVWHSQRLEVGSRSPGVRVTDSCKGASGHWESSLSTLEEQPPHHPLSHVILPY